MDRAGCSSRWRIPDRDRTRRVLTACSTHFTRPSPAVWAWDYRSAVRSSKLTGGGYGSLALAVRARPFSLPGLGGRARNVKLRPPSTPRHRELPVLPALRIAGERDDGADERVAPCLDVCDVSVAKLAVTKRLADC